jgi:chromosome partitioning protein
MHYTRKHLVEPAAALGIDAVVIDTSPSVGELQEQALWAADGVLIPCAVDYLATDGVYNITVTLKRLVDEFKWSGRILGILPTFYDTVTRESKATLQDLQKRFAGLILEPVNRATVLRECAVEGKTIFEMEASGRAARQYEAVVEKIAGVIKQK